MHRKRVLHRDIKTSNVFLTNRNLARRRPGLVLLATPCRIRARHRRALREVLPSPHAYSHRAQVKLGDFGIARQMDDTTDFAQTCVGTPYYLSPELVAGHGYDDRADLWSLGVVAYELLALRRPFTGETIGQLAMRISTAKTKPLPSSTPADLQEVVGLLL